MVNMTIDANIRRANTLHGEYLEALHTHDSFVSSTNGAQVLWESLKKIIIESKKADTVNTKELLEGLGILKEFDDQRIPFDPENFHFKDILMFEKYPTITHDPWSYDEIRNQTRTVPIDQPNFIVLGRKIVTEQLQVERCARRLVSYLKYGDETAIWDPSADDPSKGYSAVAPNRHLDDDGNPLELMYHDGRAYKNVEDSTDPEYNRFWRSFLFDGKHLRSYPSKLNIIRRLIFRLHESQVGREFLFQEISSEFDVGLTTKFVFGLDDTLFDPPQMDRAGLQQNSYANGVTTELKAAYFNVKSDAVTEYISAPRLSPNPDITIGLVHDILFNILPVIPIYLRRGAGSIEFRKLDVQKLLTSYVSLYFSDNHIRDALESIKNRLQDGTLTDAEVRELARLFPSPDVSPNTPQSEIRDALEQDLSWYENSDMVYNQLSVAELMKVTGIIADKGYDLFDHTYNLEENILSGSSSGKMAALSAPKLTFAAGAVILDFMSIFDQEGVKPEHIYGFVANIRGIIDDIQLVDLFTGSSKYRKNTIVQAATKLSWFFHLLDGVFSTTDALDEYRAGDKDAAIGVAMSAAGSGLFALVAMANANVLGAGTAASWLTATIGFSVVTICLIAAIVLAVGSIVVYMLTNDTPLQEWVKNCYFGNNFGTINQFNGPPSDRWFRFRYPDGYSLPVFWAHDQDKLQRVIPVAGKINWQRQFSELRSIAAPLGFESGGAIKHSSIGNMFSAGEVIFEPGPHYSSFEQMSIDMAGFIIVRPLFLHSEYNKQPPSYWGIYQREVKNEIKENKYTGPSTEPPLHLIRLRDEDEDWSSETKLPLVPIAGEVSLEATPEGFVQLPPNIKPSIYPVKKWNGSLTSNSSHVFGFVPSDIPSIIGNPYVELIYIPPRKAKELLEMPLWKLHITIDHMPEATREVQSFSLLP